MCLDRLSWGVVDVTVQFDYKAEIVIRQDPVFPRGCIQNPSCGGQAVLLIASGSEQIDDLLEHPPYLWILRSLDDVLGFATVFLTVDCVSVGRQV